VRTGWVCERSKWLLRKCAIAGGLSAHWHASIKGRRTNGEWRTSRPTLARVRRARSFSFIPLPISFPSWPVDSRVRGSSLSLSAFASCSRCPHQRPLLGSQPEAAACTSKSESASARVWGVMGDYDGAIHEIRTGAASTGARGACARARGLAQGGRASECRTERVAKGGRAETRTRSGAHGRGAVGGHGDVPK
jgi:hypothetical protein